MKFDLNPDTFTLENMFAMELHRFTEIIQEIVGSAVKELSIEKGITEVAETWGAMKFTIHKYMKGTQERGSILLLLFVLATLVLIFQFYVDIFHAGYIVGAVDEMLQILDDNAMNLQSMTASRFVGPFLENVNKWEKSLSHISEVVEVRS